MTWAQRIIEVIDDGSKDWLEEIINIAKIPAPSFDEAERGEYVYQRLKEVGLKDVEVDEIGNILATIRGNGKGSHVMLVAHMDTVFSREEHIQPSLNGNILKGSSVKDNASGVAALISIARLLKRMEITLPGDLTLAMSVGEEGVGNCRGMREIMKRTPVPDMVIAIDSTLGNLVTSGVASTRLEVQIQTEGGHSWGDAGKPNAIHIAAQCIADLAAIPLIIEPKTTLNVGTIEGGVSVNSIAPHVRFSLGMRSVDEDALNSVYRQVEDILKGYAQLGNSKVLWEIIGKRPAGRLPDEHPLIQMVLDVHSKLGLKTEIGAVSTDANIPLSLGIPSIALGPVIGSKTHSPGEYLKVDSIPMGLKQIVLILDEIWTAESSCIDMV